MPEGDTIRALALRLSPRLTGATVTRLAGTHRAISGEGRRIRGRRIVAVRSAGKHLLVDFDNGWSLRTHLGMTGSWRVYRPGQRWHEDPARARVVLETSRVVAVCFSAPTVQLGPHDRVAATIDHLGPDLSGPPATVDDGVLDDIVSRARGSDAATASGLLLDQSTMAGVGNVVSSECLFLERVSPRAPASSLDDHTIRRLARRANRLLAANAGPGARTTTGHRSRGHRHWVYARAGQPCRRCRSTILATTTGNPSRVAYWCPSCQPSQEEP